jgi:site-specific DNA recombinase
LRYSSDKSNPRSLVQQLKRSLQKASEYGHFVPWDYVFSDAAVSGTTPFRRGYEMSKAAISDGAIHIVALYIDEIGRASRNAIEALKLGQLIDSLGKRLIGVSDGFDTNSPMSKLMLSIFAALQEWFIDQLRAKVNRGLDDAFDQGGNLGVPAIGYKLVPHRDENGIQVFGKDGQPMNTLAIDEEQSQYVLLAFNLYAVQGWSKIRIARHFNELRIGGSQTWDNARLDQLLTRYKYAGILTFRMTQQELDHETGTLVTKYRPKSEWMVRRARHLKIVPWSLWKKAQQRLRETREAFKPRAPLFFESSVFTTLVKLLF